MPCTVEDGVAYTSSTGNSLVVLPTFTEVEQEGMFGPAFDTVTRISFLIDQFEQHGLSWDVKETT